MKEYRIDIKVRNNLILKKIEEAGYKNVTHFLRENNIYELSEIIRLRKSPFKKNMEWIPVVIKAASLLNCEPKDFFTETQLNAILRNNQRHIEINEYDMKLMLEDANSQHLLLEHVVEQDQMGKEIVHQLTSLSPREEKVLKMRFGIDEEEKTLEEVANVFGVSRERIRQTEAKALRKLRHPSRTELLRNFISED